MHDTTHQVPARLAPFLAQWDYITGVLFERLADLSDEEYLWEPATEVWTVRLVDGKPKPDVEAWAPDASAGSAAHPGVVDRAPRGRGDDARRLARRQPLDQGW